MINILGGGGSQSIQTQGTYAPQTISFYQPFWGQTFSASHASVQFYPMTVPVQVVASRLNMMVQGTLSATNAASSQAATISMSVGIYTRSGSTLSSASSGSTNYQVSDLSGGSTASLAGPRALSVPLSVTMPPGEYWVGILSASATAGNAEGFNLSQLVLNQPATISGSFASASSNTGGNMFLGQGHFNSAALPASVAFSALNMNNKNDVAFPWVGFVNYTA